MSKDKNFTERHPRWSAFLGLLILLFLFALLLGVAFLLLKAISIGAMETIEWISSLSSKLDVVVIVALITGAVSIIGVVISSVIAKIIDFKQKRREYLTQKREEPYGEFIETLYKILENANGGHTYPEKELQSDFAKFSRKITLWGSPKVVEKWHQFREKGWNTTGETDTLLILEEIMNEMRKDLGLKKVKRGNLLAFFVTGIRNISLIKKDNC